MSLSDIKYKIKSIISLLKLPKPLDTELNHNNIHSVCLVLINVGIGDAIMSTSFIHELKKMNISVDVVITKKNIDIFIENKDIRRFILKDDIVLSKIKYDLVIDPYSHCGWYFSYNYFKLLGKMDYSYLSGFNVKAPYKYYDNFTAQNGIHITDYYNHVLDKFFQGKISGQYIVDIPIDKYKNAEIITNNIAKSNLKIAFCPFASTIERSFSYAQVNEILEKLNKIKNISIIILCEKDKIKKIDITGKAYFYHTKSFLESAAILSLCDFCISSDTSFVHLSNSQNIPLISFYSSVYNDGYNTDFLCAPNYIKSKQIVESSRIRNMNVDKIVSDILDEIEVYYTLEDRLKT